MDEEQRAKETAEQMLASYGIDPKIIKLSKQDKIYEYINYRLDRVEEEVRKLRFPHLPPIEDSYRKIK